MTVGAGRRGLLISKGWLQAVILDRRLQPRGQHWFAYGLLAPALRVPRHPGQLPGAEAPAGRAHPGPITPHGLQEEQGGRTLSSLPHRGDLINAYQRSDQNCSGWTLAPPVESERVWRPAHEQL